MTYKSHFKFKKNFDNTKKNQKEKSIFLKNIIIFLLFSKIFLKNFSTSVQFTKKSVRQVNILKAPSRHKKFFHQIFFEQFLLKLSIKLKQNIFIDFCIVERFFFFIKKVFNRIGSNTLSRVKFLLSSPSYLIL